MSTSSRKLPGPFRWMLILAVVYLNAPTSTHAIQACGKHLNEILILTCGGIFPAIVKKSNDPLDYLSDMGAEEDVTLGLERWPFLSSMEGNSLVKTRRRRFGIVHECCDKQCTITELKSYCKTSV